MGVKAKITVQSYRVNDPRKKYHRNKDVFIPESSDTKSEKQKLLERLNKMRR